MSPFVKRLLLLAPKLGPNLVTNGTFDADANWTKAAPVTIVGGVAVFTNSNGPDQLYQNCGIVAGKRWRITAMVTGTGTIGAILGGVSGSAVYKSAGLAVWDFPTSVGANGNIIFYTSQSTFNGTLDNVTARQVGN